MNQMIYEPNFKTDSLFACVSYALTKYEAFSSIMRERVLLYLVNLAWNTTYSSISQVLNLEDNLRNFDRKYYNKTCIRCFLGTYDELDLLDFVKRHHCEDHRVETPILFCCLLANVYGLSIELTLKDNSSRWLKNDQNLFDNDDDKNMKIHIRQISDQQYVLIGNNPNEMWPKQDIYALRQCHGNNQNIEVARFEQCCRTHWLKMKDTRRDLIHLVYPANESPFRRYCLDVPVRLSLYVFATSLSNNDDETIFHFIASTNGQTATNPYFCLTFDVKYLIVVVAPNIDLALEWVRLEYHRVK